MLQIVRKTFFYILAALPTALADSLSYWEQQGIININFSEPIVTQTVLENQYRSDCSAADKGLDMFSISGDTRHQPRVIWVEQDCLRIEPTPGSSVQTEYTLRFRADAQYLSGRPLQQKEYTFRAPASPLLHEDLRSCPNGAALLAARYQNTVEAASLSPQTPIHFSYTRLKMDQRGDFFESGEKAGAIVEQAQLKHGNSFSMLQSLARRGVKWEELQQDAPLPGYIVVRPDRPVPAGSIWRLNAKAAPGCGIADSNLGPIYVNRSLSARLVGQGSDREKTGANVLEMRFNSPVNKAQLQQAFREMRLTLNGVETALAEDGTTRTATVEGRELRVRYLGEIETQEFIIEPHNPENDALSPQAEKGGAGTDRLVKYARPDAARGMRLAVESPVPVLMECTLKVGMQGIHGLPLEQDFSCRADVTPLVPGLPLGVEHLLPLHGEHKVQFEAVNGSKVRVRLRHWKAGEVLAALPEIESHLEQQKRRSDMALTYYHRAVMQACMKAGLAAPEDVPPAPENATRAREVYLGRIFLQGAGGTVVGQQEIELPLTGNPLASTARVQVDMDALCGGQPRPGLYLVEMDFYPSAAVVEAARELGMNPDAWELRSDALVSVSDLSPLELHEVQGTARNDMLVLRHSTGAPLHGGQMIAVTAGEAAAPVPVEHGHVTLPGGEARIMVQAGEDYFLLSNSNEYGSGADEETDGDAELRAMVWTDRAVYRPGEKVYVRGFLRAVDGVNNISHSRHRTLELHFEAPDGNRLFSRTFDVDAYGAFSQELTMPAGQEDVTGRYCVRVGTTRPRTLVKKEIYCGVFRRDSFEVSTEDKTKKIAPEELELHVQAKDYNALPLTNGRAELWVRSQAPFQGAINVGSGEHPCYEWQGNVPLGADGTAVFKLPLSGERTRDFEVQYEGSVVNDREEAHRFVSSGRYAAAEVKASLRDDDTLHLLCSCCDKPFANGMSVRVAVRVPKWSRTPLENGFTLIETRSEEVWSQWVNVPADSAEGVPVPLRGVLAQHAAEAQGPCQVEITGLDYHGRVFQSLHERDVRPGTDQTWFQVRPGETPGQVVVECGADSKVLVAIKYGRRVRVHTMYLQKGINAFALPFEGDEEGEISACVARLENKPGTGWILAQNSHDLTIQLPRRRSALQVELELPGTVRPGTEQHFAGRVTLPNGTASQAVVTLYAVDSGMLSRSNCATPDAVEALSRRKERFLGVLNMAAEVESFKDGMFTLNQQALPGVWQGEGRLGSAPWQQQPWWMRDTVPASGMDMAASPLAAVGARHKGAAAGAAAAAPVAPRVRTDFNPVALWCSALKTDSNGRFSATCALPDTLTTYRVIAVAADKEGSRFGTGEGEFVVNQPLILRAGLPLFMSVGDKLQLPVTVTNNTAAEGSWQVQLQGAGEPQPVTLAAGASATLHFEVAPRQAGRQAYRWVATGATGQDVVEGSFEVRHPAPLLKEAHHAVLAAGQGSLVPREKLAAALASAPGCELELSFSANPMLHLQGGVDFLLQESASPITECRASAVLPWLLYDRLAPLCPRLAQTADWRVPYVIPRKLKELLQYQNEDGSLPAFHRAGAGCLATSAHVAMVLRVAEERGYNLPQKAWSRLLAYLEKADVKPHHPLTRYEVARALQNREAQAAALRAALDSQEPCRWGSVRADLEFLEYLRTHNEGRHEAFLRWVRSRAADYRHQSSWRSAWSLYALITYIGDSRGAPLEATLRLPNGSTVKLNRGVYHVQNPQLEGAYSAAGGPVYAVLRAKAQPVQTEYPGVTEQGLQMTRVYEKRGEDGVWRPATDFAVGDVVRVSLTCAKAGEQELNHLVLEDYLPACMEALNPAVPEQAAGLEPLSWSEGFDQREYLADRVRGFCSRWPGRDVVNMRYYARVKRAGSATAPPAQAQLFYEPQVYGLSPSVQLNVSR